jgi:integrase
VELYWRCTRQAKAAGYKPTVVKLFETEEVEIAKRCAELQAEMLGWMAGKSGASKPLPQYTTISYLFDSYRDRPSSPYHQVKWNTRKTYDQILDTIDESAGHVRLNQMNMDTFYTWFNDARWPEGKGGIEHLRKAVGIISMMRRVVSFGVAAEIEECARLHAILSNMRFPGYRKRTSTMTVEHVEAIVDEALKQNRLSLALGMALQFECGLRQRDVIGEWEPVEGKPTSHYLIGRRQWANGLTWDMIGSNWILTKTTTKTGAVVNYDLALAPMAKRIIELIPIERRSFGPVIVDETANRPYAEHAYQREWRKIANAAGVPSSVCNMDARSGAATEASDAGAALGDTQAVLGHTDERTTARYVRGDNLAKTRRVAKLRLMHRENEN